MSVVCVCVYDIFKVLFTVLLVLNTHAFVVTRWSRRTAPAPAGSNYAYSLTVEELALRLGTEFMTLGFLACVVFLCSIAGFFDFLADTTESTHAAHDYCL